jgi:hypothetical protein
MISIIQKRRFDATALFPSISILLAISLFSRCIVTADVTMLGLSQAVTSVQRTVVENTIQDGKSRGQHPIDQDELLILFHLC